MSAQSAFHGLRIEPLDQRHQRSEFSCRVKELDFYIRQQATQDQRRRLASVFVLANDNGYIAGFYTLSATSIMASELPDQIAKGLPRYPIPITLLGRLAVSLSDQGKGLGKVLLVDALQRSLLGSIQIASWAVVVDAKPEARDFYPRHDFIPLEERPNRLVLPMKYVERLFG